MTAGHELRLRDGARVLIRPIAPEDRELMRAGFARLGPESRYRRFLTLMTRLSDEKWQGCGLGSELLRALADRARDEEIERFTCLVLAENRAMIEMLDQLGMVREIDRRPGTVELTVSVPPAAEGTVAELRQLLRAAASGTASFVAERTGGFS